MNRACIPVSRNRTSVRRKAKPEAWKKSKASGYSGYKTIPGAEYGVLTPAIFSTLSANVYGFLPPTMRAVPEKNRSYQSYCSPFKKEAAYSFIGHGFAHRR